MTAAWPLDRFPLVRTCDVDEFHAALATIYSGPRLELLGRDKTVDVAINRYPLRHTDLSFGSYAAEIHMEFPETGFVSQIIPVRGKAEAWVGRTKVAMGAGRSVVISADATFGLIHNADYERFIFKIDESALKAKLAALVGAPIDRLTFQPEQDGRHPMAKAFRNHFMFLVNQVNASDPPLPKAMLTEFEQALMVMFLHANRNNYSPLLERRAADAAPSEVRRAEEFIEANADRPITLEDLARVTGVSAFSLFRAFRKSRGYSPLEFAARVRSQLRDPRQ